MLMAELPFRIAPNIQSNACAGLKVPRVMPICFIRMMKEVRAPVHAGAFGVGYLSKPAESKRKRALSPSIWAVSREVSKPVISGVSPS